jgi:hypothetical protein
MRFSSSVVLAVALLAALTHVDATEVQGLITGETQHAEQVAVEAKAGHSLRGDGLLGSRSLQAEDCRNEYQCAANSTRKSNRKCYNNQDDCECLPGYGLKGQLCLPDPSCIYQCAANSIRKPNRKCYNNQDDCECLRGYIQVGQKCRLSSGAPKSSPEPLPSTPVPTLSPTPEPSTRSPVPTPPTSGDLSSAAPTSAPEPWPSTPVPTLSPTLSPTPEPSTRSPVPTPATSQAMSVGLITGLSAAGVALIVLNVLLVVLVCRQRKAKRADGLDQQLPPVAFPPPAQKREVRYAEEAGYAEELPQQTERASSRQLPRPPTRGAAGLPPRESPPAELELLDNIPVEIQIPPTDDSPTLRRIRGAFIIGGPQEGWTEYIDRETGDSFWVSNDGEMRNETPFNLTTFS